MLDTLTRCQALNTDLVLKNRELEILLIFNLEGIKETGRLTMDKEIIAQISTLVAEATEKLQTAEALAKGNKIPFDFQLASLIGKKLYENDEQDYDNPHPYPDNDPIVIGTEGMEGNGWEASGLYC